MTTPMVRDVMTADPITLDSGATAVDAARAMRDSDIGAIIVLDGDGTCGIVTDRDITIRVIAEGRDPATTKLGDICSRDLTTLAPTDSTQRAIELMREKAIRRIPVVEGDQPVGIVSLGDVSVEQDAGDALADISSAPANN